MGAGDPALDRQLEAYVEAGDVDAARAYHAEHAGCFADPARAAELLAAATEAEGPALTFVPLSGGEFCMGSPPGEPGRDGDEAQRWVRLDGFAIATTETTREAYAAWRAGRDAYAEARDDARPTVPATDVDWPSARAFCQSLGPGFDLPTEAQWEYAARGGAATAYSFGDDPARLGEHAWFGENASYEAHPVGEKTPNPVGLYDIHGNVWEWVRDGWREHTTRVVDTLVHIPCHQCGPGAGRRVSRGGSFVDPARYLRSAIRNLDGPGVRDWLQGFRCAGPRSLELAPSNP